MSLRNDSLDLTAITTYNIIELTRQEFHASVQTSHHEVLDAKITRWDDVVTGDLNYRLDGFLWGQQQPKEVSYPATWWQHLKYQLAPAWMLSRWPVRMTTITYQEMIVCPNVRDLTPHSRSYRAVAAMPVRGGIPMSPGELEARCKALKDGAPLDRTYDVWLMEQALEWMRTPIS